MAHLHRALTFNVIKPSAFFTNRQVYHSKVVHGAGFVLSVLCGSENKQQRLLYTAITDLIL
jgi:hypothetical protein